MGARLRVRHPLLGRLVKRDKKPYLFHGYHPDLVAKSKSFVSKHATATRAGAGMLTATNFDGCGGPFRSGNITQPRSSHVNALNRPIPINAIGNDIANYNDLCKQHQMHNNLDNCYAFDNPYFSDTRKDCLLAAQQKQQICSPEAQQLHFIENRISTLHNKQVTSSVNELTGAQRLNNLGDNCDQHQLNVLADGPNGVEPVYLSAGRALPVVDLTSPSERAKILADPKQGDLVAVDLTGHDFIGLGFDVCGNERSGIYIKSVLARGPARDSGCVEPGDRIKCLNIAFDNITLSDACELLNCAAPYKMRMLLEKRMCDDEDMRRLSTAGPISNGSAKGRNSWSPSAHINPLSALRDIKLDSHQSSDKQHLRPISMPYNTRPLVAMGEDNHNNSGPLKTYMRRLSRLVAPNTDWLRNSAGNINDAHTIRNNESYVAPLGSAAARLRSHGLYPNAGVDLPLYQHQDSLMSQSSSIGLANVGFCCDDVDADECQISTNVAANRQNSDHQVSPNKTTKRNQQRDIPLLQVEHGARIKVDKIDDLSKICQGTTTSEDNDGYYSDGEHIPHSISSKSKLPGQLLPPVQGRSRRQTVAGLVENALSSQLNPIPISNVSTSASNIDPSTPTYHLSREEGIENTHENVDRSETRPEPSRSNLDIAGGDKAP